MTQNEAITLCTKIIKNYKKDSSEKENTIADLKKLRNYFIEIQDPLITKIVRLAYQYLENNASFDIAIEDFEPSEEQSTFNYFMELMMKYDHAVNRKELQEFKLRLEEA